MALIESAGALFGALLLAVAWTASGERILRAFGVQLPSGGERLLCAAAGGVIAYEAVLAVAECSGLLRTAVLAAFAATLLSGLPEVLPVLWATRKAFSRIAAGTRAERALASLTALVLAFEGIAAVAPLTGSDALRYHFTVEFLALREGFHANFSSVHSFFAGQGHLLILTGLVLAGEKLALALLFLGGALAAFACACLARKWVSREGSRLCALVFLVTPVVFWQITSSGSPDVWMAFFTTVSVLLIARTNPQIGAGMAIGCGALAGGIAGGKYTGCIIAAGVMFAFVWQVRSPRKLVVFLAGAFGAGMWPYARNFAWSGDPFFPFLIRWIDPAKLNAYTLESIAGDTGASGATRIWQVAGFPLFAALDHEHFGFWQFLGPLCLALAPMILLAVRNTPLWRVALTVWLVSGVGLGLVSGMPRFLLAVLPIALAAVIAGIAEARRREWRWAIALSSVSVAFFLALCGGGLLLYGRASVAAAIGATGREAYLRERAPDYGRVEFINQAMWAVLQGESPSKQGTDGRVLVFLQHTYYLQVPYVPGNPNSNWTVDPTRLTTTVQWMAFFREQNIKWVVRAPEYPSGISVSLQRLEREGELVPMVRGEAEDFEGMRIADTRNRFPMVILRVAN